VLDDQLAGPTVVEFIAPGSASTEVALTHATLERHGDAAPEIHAALDGPSPGAKLPQYARTGDCPRT